MPRKIEPKTAESPMTLRLPDEWHEALREKAHKERTTKTDLIKEALRQTYGFADPKMGG